MLLRLLVVDDDLTLQFAMQDYFTQQRYVVDCVGTRSAAEALLLDRCYTALITDLHLHGTNDQDGLTVIEYARTRCPDMPIVLLTAYSNAEIVRAAQARGADIVLEKPQPLAAVAHALVALRRKGLGQSGTVSDHSCRKKY